MAEEDKIKTESSRNWSELRLELLELILKRLALVDMARFKLVSKSWYAASQSYISSPITYKPLVPQAPWLLFPRCCCDGDDGRFFSFLEKKVYTFRNLFEGIGDHELLGSSYGWLVTWDSNLHRVHLFNPISRVRILLPSDLRFRYLILRVFLSSDPSCNNTFYVVVLYSEKQDTKIAFHKHGDHDGNSTTAWTDLDSVDGGFGRMFFHNSLLLGMSLDSNSIRVCNFGATTFSIKTIDFQPPQRDTPQRNYGRYLVESQGEVLFIEKLKNPISSHYYYEIHKLNFTPNKVECLKVKCLQDRILILSAYGSESISLSTLDIPELEANTIYVAQDKQVFPQGGHRAMYLEVEAYNLENKGFKSFFRSEVRRSRPLLWIVPNPCNV